MSKKNQAAKKNVAIETTVAPATKETKGNGRRVEPIVLSTSQDKEFKALTTTSARIRYLHAEKFTNGQIALFLGKRYQHVRNVLTTPLKKAEATTSKATA